MPELPPRILIIAGSDSGGGAGLQADIKTVSALGGYAATAVTAVTVQNTMGVAGAELMPPALVAAQMEAVLTDIGADAIKIGMLGSEAIVRAVADVLEAHAPGIPVVLDPVMIAKGGAALIDDTAIEALHAELIPRARIVTPNAPEASRLTGVEADSVKAAEEAGQVLVKAGAGAALVKGGHLDGPEVTDVLVVGGGETMRWTAPRIDTRHTHGTGCTLASAIAMGLSQGLSAGAAVELAHGYVREAIARAPGFGSGHGPLDHGWTLRAYAPNQALRAARAAPVSEVE